MTLKLNISLKTQWLIAVSFCRFSFWDNSFLCCCCLFEKRDILRSYRDSPIILIYRQMAFVIGPNIQDCIGRSGFLQNHKIPLKINLWFSSNYKTTFEIISANKVAENNDIFVEVIACFVMMIGIISKSDISKYCSTKFGTIFKASSRVIFMQNITYKTCYILFVHTITQESCTILMKNSWITATHLFRKGKKWLLGLN